MGAEYECVEHLTLTTPDVAYEATYRDYLAALHAAGEPEYGNYACVLRDVRDDFGAFVRWFDQLTAGHELPEGCLSQHVFWLLADGKVAGESQVTRWQETGFSTGYVIHPLERRKGYGARMLALTLAEAQALGAETVFATCRSTNVASSRVIMKNGGVLVREYVSARSGNTCQQYRIDLS